ncbi:MAG TPA: SpoIID/LytB domain-containing protein [Tepidisphaeraceae bacterium]
MKTLWVRIAVLVSALTAVSCSPRPVQRVDRVAPVVRVRLLAGVDQATLTLDATPVLISDDGQKRRRISGAAGQSVVVTRRDEGWNIGSGEVQGGALEIQPADVGTVRINGIAYRGSFRLVPAAGGRFDVVNDVDVESYLMGVLARELLPDWKPEAYKAQAMIARTYALYEAANVPTGRHWDLHPDERSQVYGGMKGETAKAIDAVNATRGEVVVWGPPGREKIFKTYFSSCCGGVSADAADAFGEPNIPPLTSVDRGTTCAISSRYNWPAVTVSKAELSRRFKLWAIKQNHGLAGAGDVARIEVAATNAAGRPRGFVVIDGDGKRFNLVGEQLRWAINTDAKPGTTVFSNYFRPADAGDAITFADGHGFGHGVGACQWCMQAKALAGRPARQIALDAYPQADVVTAY